MVRRDATSRQGRWGEEVPDPPVWTVDLQRASNRFAVRDRVGVVCVDLLKQLRHKGVEQDAVNSNIVSA